MSDVTNRDEETTDAAATVDLRPLGRALHRGRAWMVVGIVVGIVGGFIGWWTSGVSYDAVVTLAVNQPRSAPRGTTLIPTTGYVPLIQNHTVIAGALERAGLSTESAPLHPNKFMGTALSVDALPGTNLIRIRVRQREPGRAVMVAQEVASGAVDLSRALGQEEGRSLRDQLESQLQEAADRLAETEEGLLGFRRTSQLELAQEEVAKLVKQQGTLAKLETELAGVEARVAAGAEWLASRSSTVALEQSIARSPTLTEIVRPQTGGDPAALLGVGLTNEELNPAYQAVDEKIGLATARLAQLRQERAAIRAASDRLRKSSMLSDMYSQEIELERRQADVELAREMYDDVAMRYEQARLVVTSGSAQLQIVDAAIALPEPASWSLPLWLAIGALLGFAGSFGMIGLAAVLAQIGRN